MDHLLMQPPLYPNLDLGYYFASTCINNAFLTHTELTLTAIPPEDEPGACKIRSDKISRCIFIDCLESETNRTIALREGFSVCRIWMDGLDVDSYLITTSDNLLDKPLLDTIATTHNIALFVQGGGIVITSTTPPTESSSHLPSYLRNPYASEVLHPGASISPQSSNVSASLGGCFEDSQGNVYAEVCSHLFPNPDSTVIHPSNTDLTFLKYELKNAQKSAQLGLTNALRRHEKNKDTPRHAATAISITHFTTKLRTLDEEKPHLESFPDVIGTVTSSINRIIDVPDPLSYPDLEADPVTNLPSTDLPFRHDGLTLNSALILLHPTTPFSPYPHSATSPFTPITSPSTPTPDMTVTKPAEPPKPPPEPSSAVATS